MISAATFQRIYKMLDDITPLSYDCGSLCDSICCRYELFQKDSYDFRIFMFPGEDAIHDKTDTWLKWEYQSAMDNGFPDSWGEKILTVRCNGPEKCKRTKRPFQCRTFPLEPIISKKGYLELIYCRNHTPYICPLIQNRLKLAKDFIKTTYMAWEMLLKDDQIYDLVQADSRRRSLLFCRTHLVYSPTWH